MVDGWMDARRIVSVLTNVLAKADANDCLVPFACVYNSFIETSRNAGDGKLIRKKTDIAPPGPAKRGAPFQMEEGRRVNVFLDAATIEAAKALGNGNLSAGLRAAVVSAGKPRAAGK
jgi:hypothetical protein